MRLSVQNKLYGGFGITVLLLLVVSVIGYSSLSSVASATGDVQNAAEMDDAVMSMMIALRDGMEVEANAIFSGTSSEQTLADFQITVDAFDDSLATLEEQGDESIQATLAEADAAHAVFQDAVLASLAMVKDGDTAGAIQNNLTVTDGAIETANEALGSIEEEVEAFGDASLAGAESTKSSSSTLVIAISAIAVAMAAALAWFISRGIVGGVRKLVVAAEGIAEGDLQHDVSVSTNDEIGDMATAFGNMVDYLSSNAETAEAIADGDLTVDVKPKSERDTLGNAFSSMVLRLRETMGQVRGTADALASAKDELSQSADQAATATGEVASTTQQIAEGSSQQATSVQETSKGIAQLDESATKLQEQAEQDVAQAAELMAASAQEATEGAAQAADKATQGAEMVQRTVDGIARIKASIDSAAEEVAGLGDRSQEIGKIVAVIEDIAAQTNLLALNAAIEAARAGEQGRGFAVVADEVRQLAERVAAATKEIAELIGGVQMGVDGTVKAMQEGAEEMDAGTVAAAEAAGALEEILGSVEVVKDQIDSIASGSDQLKVSSADMVTVVGEVKGIAVSASDSVASIASIAEENAASSEQVSAAAEEMTAQVDQVSAASKELGRMADDLRDQVSSFRLDANGSVAVRVVETRAEADAVEQEAEAA